MCLCGRSRFIAIICGYVICLDVHVHVSFLGSLCVGVVPVCVCVGICVHVCMHAHVCYPWHLCRYLDQCDLCVYVPLCFFTFVCVYMYLHVCVLPLCLQAPATQGKAVYPAQVSKSPCLMLSMPPPHPLSA